MSFNNPAKGILSYPLNIPPKPILLIKIMSYMKKKIIQVYHSLLLFPPFLIS